MSQATLSAAFTPRPVFPLRARDLVHHGKQMVDDGQFKQGAALLRSALALDPSVVCLPWGMMPHLAAQGRDIYLHRMRDRLQSWYRAPHSTVHAQAASLTQKPVMHRYINQLGLPLPRQIMRADRIEALDWDNMPDAVVIKPENGSSSKGVIVAADGFDHIAQAPIGPDFKAYASALYARTFDKPPSVFVEERLRDVHADADPGLIIPRDFKIFAAGGNVAVIMVQDRNAPDGRRSMAGFDRSGRRLPISKTDWPAHPDTPADPMMPEPEPAPLLPGWDQLIGMAEYLSQKQPWLLRLDFYLTPHGPVFGEFTTFPSAGLDQSPFSRRTLLQLWECWPDG